MIFRVIIHYYGRSSRFIGSPAVDSFSSWCSIFNILIVIIVCNAIKFDKFICNMCWSPYECKAFKFSGLIIYMEICYCMYLVKFNRWINGKEKRKFNRKVIRKSNTQNLIKITIKICYKVSYCKVLQKFVSKCDDLWCGNYQVAKYRNFTWNFVETHRFSIVLGKLPETIRKPCVSTQKFHTRKSDEITLF